MSGSNFDQAAFDELVLKNGVIGFSEKPVRFKSGRESNCYVNWRNALADVWLSDRVADHLLGFVKDLGLEPRCFYGVPDGITKLGILAQYKWATARPDYGPGVYPLAMGRKTPKEHGDPRDKYFVGAPRGATIVLEDTTTTGGSLLDTVAALREVEVPIVAALALTNRSEKRDDGTSVADALKQQGVPYYALSSLPDLLPRALEIADPSPHVRDALKAYTERYGI